MIYFESERLIFRDWNEQDEELFCLINADSDVMRYYPKPATREDSIRFITIIKDEINKYGYGLFAVEEKFTHSFIGYIGFHYASFEADFTPCLEIGWKLDKNTGIRVMQPKELMLA
jgi:ribosomal-protein-alanine N-acetyltransferase